MKIIYLQIIIFTLIGLIIFTGRSVVSKSDEDSGVIYLDSYEERVKYNLIIDGPIMTEQDLINSSELVITAFISDFKLHSDYNEADNIISPIIYCKLEVEETISGNTPNEEMTLILPDADITIINNLMTKKLYKFYLTVNENANSDNYYLTSLEDGIKKE